MDEAKIQSQLSGPVSCLWHQSYADWPVPNIVLATGIWTKIQIVQYGPDPLGEMDTESNDPWNKLALLSWYLE